MGASPCGALDMAGNVWEYVGDRIYVDEPLATLAPFLDKLNQRFWWIFNYEYIFVMRGGSFAPNKDGLRTSVRIFRGGGLFSSSNDFGFRCAISPE